MGQWTALLLLVQLAAELVAGNSFLQEEVQMEMLLWKSFVMKERTRTDVLGSADSTDANAAAYVHAVLEIEFGVSLVGLEGVLVAV